METIIKPKYAERLRQLRQENGLTQQQLASHVKMYQPDIAAFEAGKRELKDISLMRLARFFGVNPYYLSGESDLKFYEKL